MVGLLPPTSAVEVIKTEPFVCVCVCVCQCVGTLKAERIDEITKYAHEHKLVGHAGGAATL